MKVLLDIATLLRLRAGVRRMVEHSAVDDTVESEFRDVDL